jgi:hypothetical protein
MKIGDNIRLIRDKEKTTPRVMLPENWGLLQKLMGI